jgi:hypothetical protein
MGANVETLLRAGYEGNSSVVNALRGRYGVSGGASAPSSSTRYGGLKSHFSKSEESLEKEKLQQEIDRREKRGDHLDLVNLLEDMKYGGHSPQAWLTGNKFLYDVKMCPGQVQRHGACGGLVFKGYSCDMPLCPWCAARRASRLVETLEKLAAAYLERPKLLSLTAPNVDHLTGKTFTQWSEAFSRLLRRKVVVDVKGGCRSIEVTRNESAGSWHPHIHSLLDMPWVAQYPCVDIYPKGCYWLREGAGIDGEWVNRADFKGWEVQKSHQGLAREWTEICQKFSELKSTRVDFDLNNPDHWYFIDIRKADNESIREVAKYVVKGNDVVSGGIPAVIEYVYAVRRHRMFSTFGSLWGVDVDPAAGEIEGDKAGSDHEEAGLCPWPDCPDRESQEWTMVCRGHLETTLGADYEWDDATGYSRVIVGGALRGPPH